MPVSYRTTPPCGFIFPFVFLHIVFTFFVIYHAFLIGVKLYQNFDKSDLSRIAARGEPLPDDEEDGQDGEYPTSEAGGIVSVSRENLLGIYWLYCNKYEQER